MKRLSDLPANDRLSLRVHALIRATGATVQSEERLLRVRRLLDAAVQADVSGWGWRLGPALGLLGISAAAGGSESVKAPRAGNEQ
jgi:hypothetical protein